MWAHTALGRGGTAALQQPEPAPEGRGGACGGIVKFPVVSCEFVALVALHGALFRHSLALALGHGEAAGALRGLPRGLRGGGYPPQRRLRPRSGQVCLCILWG